MYQEKWGRNLLLQSGNVGFAQQKTAHVDFSIEKLLLQ